MSNLFMRSKAVSAAPPVSTPPPAATPAPSAHAVELEAARAELKLHKDAMTKIAEVASAAASGNLEARLIGLEPYGDLRPAMSSINDLLDLVDAYVREASASLEYSAQGKFFRPFLERGMKGQFRRGAKTINDARGAMQRFREESRSTRLRLADEFEKGVSSVVDMVASASTQLESTAQKMTAAAEQEHKQSLSMSQASVQAQNNTQAVASATEELAAAIGEINRQAEDSNTAAQSVVAQMEEAGGAIKDLKDVAGRINSVIEFIVEVANKTNLLALNATIEAARAGNAGKGFAVVANEGKQLAEETKKATKEIGAQIEAMHQSTERTASIIEEINTRTAAVSKSATAITAAVQQQSAATGEISRNVHQAADATALVSNNAADITKASEETGQSAKQVLDAASGLKSHADSLSNSVRQFLEAVRAA